MSTLKGPFCPCSYPASLQLSFQSFPAYTTVVVEAVPINIATATAAILYNLGKFDEAIGYYVRALATDPNDTDALKNKGNALDSLGKFDEAIGYYVRALATDPNDTDALKNKGNALDSLGKFDEAIGYYDRALATDPNDTDALKNKTFSY